MRMLATTLAPSAGRLEVLGLDVLQRARELKRQLGVVPQGTTLDTELEVRDNLTTFGRYHGMTWAESGRRASELLELVDLTEHSSDRVDQLSGGMQRRLLVARALVNRPALLLLDEPTAGVDAEARQQLWQRLVVSGRRETTILLSTHYLEEVERICDEVVVLAAGSVTRQATPDRLVAESVPSHVVEIPEELAVAVAGTAEPVLDLDGLRRAVGDPVLEGVRLARTGGRVLLFTADPAGLLGQLRRAGLDRDLRARPSTLEDALLAGAPNPVTPRVAPGRAGQPAGHHRRSAAAPTAGRMPMRKSGAPSPRRAALIWERNARLFRRNYVTTVLPNFFEPVFMLIALGLGLGQYVARDSIGRPYAQFLVPGLLTVAVTNGAIFEVTYNIFVRLRHARVYDAVVTTPLEPQDVTLGELIWSLTRSAVYGVVFLSLVTVAGLIPLHRALLLPLVFPLVGLPFACLGMLYTGRVRMIGQYSYFYTLFLTPMTLFSGVFFPVDAMPPAAKALAWCTPLYHGVELLRAITEAAPASVALGHIAWLTLVGAALVPAAIRSLGSHLVG